MPHVRLRPDADIGLPFETWPIDGCDRDGERFKDRLVDPGPMPDEVAFARERTALLLCALRRIPRREAVALRLRFGLGGRDPMTLQGIADRTGVTREGVRQRILAARRDLRRILLRREA